MYPISIYMNITQPGCDGVIRAALTQVKAASEFSGSRRGKGMGGGDGVMGRGCGWGADRSFPFPRRFHPEVAC